MSGYGNYRDGGGDNRGSRGRGFTGDLNDGYQNDRQGGYDRNNQGGRDGGYNQNQGSHDRDRNYQGRDGGYNQGNQSNNRGGQGGYNQERGGNRGGNQGYNQNQGNQGYNQNQGNQGYNQNQGNQRSNQYNRPGGNQRDVRSGLDKLKIYEDNLPPSMIGTPYNSAMNSQLCKKDLIYHTQTFAARPEKMVQDSKLGTKIGLKTNHTLVTLPTDGIELMIYAIEIVSNRKRLTKREDASVAFWNVYSKNRDSFPPIQEFIFNDVDTIWTTKHLGARGMDTGQDTISYGRTSVTYKFVTAVLFGGVMNPDELVETSALYSQITDAIATARVRHPANANHFTVFKRLTYLVSEEAGYLSYPMSFGTKACVGLSIAIKTNIRAGITACFDINHTLFTVPGYPLVRLFLEFSLNKVYTDEELENLGLVEEIKKQIPDEENLRYMDGVVKKLGPLVGNMKLTYTPQSHWMGPHEKLMTPRSFKFNQFGLPANQARFSMGDRFITVEEYYKITYDYTLKFPHLPVLIKKKKRQEDMSVMWPMELVSYCAFPMRHKGTTPPEMKSELIKKTTYALHERQDLLEKFISQEQKIGGMAVVDNNDEYMKRYNVEFGKEMLKCQGTVLPAPTLVYGNGTFHDHDNFGVWKAIDEEPMRTVLPEGLVHRTGEKKNLKKRVYCGIIRVENPQYHHNNSFEIDNACINSILIALERAGQPVAWIQPGQAAMIGTFKYKQGQKQDPKFEGNYAEELKNSLELCKKAAKDDHDKYAQEGEVLIPLIFLVFRNRSKDYATSDFMNDYNFLKLQADHTVGIYTQGILFNNLHAVQENPTVCPLTHHLVEKILGKIGTTHSKILSSTGKGSHKAFATLTNPAEPTLVCGIDVCHPAAEKRKMFGQIVSMSVASIVGNIDIGMTQFRASSRIQEEGQERIVKMDEIFSHRLCDFMKNTGKFPHHIVIYRDGIAEGDFKKTLYEERISIERVLTDMGKNKVKPTLTYIVVSKRHHTKFFPTDLADVRSCQDFNLKPGTLIEDVVTSSLYYDFFLSTQVGDTGAAKPTHYYVLHDTWAPMVSFWPAVTHAFSYAFCRTTSTIALPAPVMYAHLAAKRAKEMLDATSDEKFLNGKSTEYHFANDYPLTQMMEVHKDLDGMTFV